MRRSISTTSGCSRAAHVQRLGAVRRLADDLDLVPHGQERRQCLAEQRLVVDEQHAHGRRSCGHLHVQRQPVPGGAAHVEAAAEPGGPFPQADERRTRRRYPVAHRPRRRTSRCRRGLAVGVARAAPSPPAACLRTLVSPSCAARNSTSSRSAVSTRTAPVSSRCGGDARGRRLGGELAERLGERRGGPRLPQRAHRPPHLGQCVLGLALGLAEDLSARARDRWAAACARPPRASARRSGGGRGRRGCRGPAGCAPGWWPAARPGPRSRAAARWPRPARRGPAARAAAGAVTTAANTAPIERAEALPQPVGQRHAHVHQRHERGDDGGRRERQQDHAVHHHDQQHQGGARARVGRRERRRRPAPARRRRRPPRPPAPGGGRRRSPTVASTVKASASAAASSGSPVVGRPSRTTTNVALVNTARARFTRSLSGSSPRASTRSGGGRACG